jgi:hypothetical protein
MTTPGQFVEYSLEEFIDALDLLDALPVRVPGDGVARVSLSHEMTGPRMIPSPMLGTDRYPVHALVYPGGLMVVSETVWEIMK